MTLMTITREAKFDAAHFLQGHNSKCDRIHGHTWLLSVSVSGPVRDVAEPNAEVAADQIQGMVCDLGMLKRFLARMTETYDHQTLNTFDPYPTTERMLSNIAHSAKIDLEPLLPGLAFVSGLTLCEQPLTPRFWAEIKFTGRGWGQ